MTYTVQTSSNTLTSPEIIQFFETFYAVSDDPSSESHDAYADSVTEDGTLIMGTKKAVGRDQIYALRKGLWSGPVKTRKHTVNNIYAFGSNGDDARDVMLNGSVDYVLHNGKDVTVEWAARAQFVSVQGKLRMKFYQVYLDSAPVAAAAKAE